MREATGSAGSSPARCVLLHRPDVRAPEPLLSALSRRDIDVSTCTSAHRAMAMLCALAARDDQAPLILLLVDGAHLNLAAALVDAAEIYVPVATVWAYDDEEQPQLRAIDRSDLDAWSRSGLSTGDAAAGPALKLVDGGGERPPTASTFPPSPDDRPGDPADGSGPTPPVPESPAATTPSGGVDRAGIADLKPRLPDAGSAGAGSDDPAGPGVSSPVSLTDDELSMLLAEDWTDPDSV